MKFRLKIAAVTVILVSLFFALGAGALLDSSFRVSLEREKEAALASYRTVTDALALTGTADSRTANPAVILRRFTSGGTSSWSGMWLREENGVLLYHWGKGKDESDRDDAEHTLRPGCYLRVEADRRGEEQIRVVGRIASGGSPVFGMTFDVSKVYDLRAEQERIYLLSFLLTASLAAVFSWLAARLLTRPMAALSRASRAISQGDLTARAPEGGDDEIGALSREFNDMAESVEKSVELTREEAEKKERFMGYFAHEMKTPMTSVIGYADLIRSGMLEGEEAKDAAGTIFSEGKRLESLSAKLLELLVAGRDGLSLEPCRPGELVRDYVKRNAPLTAEKGIELTEACEEGTAMLDAVLFLSLLGNLAENAARALTGGGHIRLAVNMTEDGFLLSVRDDGPGIPEEALAHLTEAFYRVDKARSRKNGGAGLGLTLCERIAELHNGGLSFRSEPGKGTLVTARFAAGRGRPSGKGDDRND